jgi:hypothetical protein
MDETIQILIKVFQTTNPNFKITNVV